MKKKYTVEQVLVKIGETIKDTLAKHEQAQIDLRKKELEASGKLNKSELCLLCAEPEFDCACLRKNEKLEKKTPPDISEKTMHKLKDEYGHDKAGKEKAYATAWSIENKMKKDEMSTSYASKAGTSFGDKGKVKAAYGDGPHDQRPAMHSAMGATAPHDKANAFIEPKKVNPMRKDMVDASDPASTMSMNEKALDKGEMCKTCGKSKDLCKCMGKAEIKTTPKDTPNDEGNGDMPGKPLKKNALAPQTPKVTGIPGKQPIGQGGGDMNKATVAPNPQNTPGMGDVKGGAAQWSAQGLPQLKQNLQAVKGGVSWLKGTHASAHRISPKMAAPASQRFHGALPLQRNEKAE